MGVLNMSKRSWDSLSSTFSHLEISLSRDSCYASDDMSVPSMIKPVTTDPAMIPSVVPSTETSIRTILKPILKRSYAEIEDDEESESGYASDSSEYRPEDIFEETDGDMCDIPDWDDNTSEAISELCIDDIESFDGSFISFESTVRFDSNVHYIEPPQYQEDEIVDTGMTCHEMMKAALASSYPNKSHEETYSGAETIDDAGHEAISDCIEQLPEHTSDIIDLDKSLFLAYMNGINAIANPEYRTRLRARVADFKSGRVPSPFLDMDSANGMYLDTVLSHVIGTFRSIVIKEEIDELAGLSGNAHICQEPDPSVKIFEKIEQLLSQRLTSGDLDIGPDELSFFASGVAYVLENWKCYASN
ncbi:hypothetical protein BDW59DRAFT_5301 [Aspergillus cavernicola]|uniref:Aflatoxin regulatory protein domain-containing protein n=1 Tax=Aspergillus cavernicola TaxID=176166 RepID=A0ABR4J594_9EURO